MAASIELINCDLQVLKWIIEGDDAIHSHMGLEVPCAWTEFRDVFPYVIEQIKPNPAQAIWWTYLPIHKEKRILLGSCGFKGPPDESGVVEIGYEVARDFRNQGFATEIARTLVDKAKMDERVKGIQAHTLPEKNASTRVLEKTGFHFVEAMQHFEDGLIWKWKLSV